MALKGILGGVAGGILGGAKLIGTSIAASTGALPLVGAGLYIAGSAKKGLNYQFKKSNEDDSKNLKEETLKQKQFGLLSLNKLDDIYNNVVAIRVMLEQDDPVSQLREKALDEERKHKELIGAIRNAYGPTKLTATKQSGFAELITSLLAALGAMLALANMDKIKEFIETTLPEYLDKMSEWAENITEAVDNILEFADDLHGLYEYIGAAILGVLKAPTINGPNRKRNRFKPKPTIKGPNRKRIKLKPKPKPKGPNRKRRRIPKPSSIIPKRPSWRPPPRTVIPKIPGPVIGGQNDKSSGRGPNRGRSSLPTPGSAGFLSSFFKNMSVEQINKMIDDLPKNQQNYFGGKGKIWTKLREWDLRISKSVFGEMVGKTLKRVALPIAYFLTAVEALEIFGDWQNSPNRHKNDLNPFDAENPDGSRSQNDIKFITRMSELVGVFGGSMVGAVLGSVIGSFFTPGIGTILGMLGGAWVGSLAGERLGRTFAESLTGSIETYSETENNSVGKASRARRAEKIDDTMARIMGDSPHIRRWTGKQIVGDGRDWDDLGSVEIYPTEIDSANLQTISVNSSSPDVVIINTNNIDGSSYSENNSNNQNTTISTGNGGNLNGHPGVFDEDPSTLLYMSP